MGRNELIGAHKIKDRMEVFPLPEAPIRRTWDECYCCVSNNKKEKRTFFFMVVVV